MARIIENGKQGVMTQKSEGINIEGEVVTVKKLESNDEEVIKSA